MLMVIVSILSMAAGVLAAMFTVVMLMAGGANASPKQVRQLWMMIWGVLIVAAGSLAGAIVLAVGGRWGWAAAAGALPIAACTGLITWMWVTEY